MKKPVIGILGVYMKEFAGPSTIAGKPRTYVQQAYPDSVAKNGGIPMVIPFTRDRDLVIESLKLCDGVVAPGGIDADPSFFGEEPHVNLGEVNRELDEMQLTALQYLLEHNVPTLGICRGLQMMNIATGGTLYQDLGEFPTKVNLHRQTEEPCYPTHGVTVTAGSRVAALLGGESIRVNSFHHQAIKDVGKGFTVTAKASDGVIEAIEHENGLWLGVQWHPEQMTAGGGIMNALFRDLVEKASK